MQTSNRFLHDLAKVASGAVSTMAGLRSEIDSLIRQRLDRLAGDLDLVSREEFDAVKEMAATARAEQERLAARIGILEKAMETAGISSQQGGESGEGDR